MTGKIEQENGQVHITGYGFLVGKIPYKIPYFLIPRRIREAMQTLADTDGLLGVAPLGSKTLVVYETLNDAKRAKNILLSEGIEVFGKEITEIDTTAGGAIERYV